MLRLMIVDDEPPALRGLKRIMQAHEDVVVIGEARTLDEAQELTSALKPDAIFLDIELGNERGFDLVERLDPTPAVVVVTAHSAYAPQAFDIAALDFLQKPISGKRLALTLERLRHYQLTIGNTAGQPSGNAVTVSAVAPTEQRIHIRMAGQSLIIPTNGIAVLTAEADFTRIVMADGREYLVCRLLGQFDTELRTPPFLRVSRSLIINVNHVELVRSHGSGCSLVSLGQSIGPLVLGRAATKRLRTSLLEAH